MSYSDINLFTVITVLKNYDLSTLQSLARSLSQNAKPPLWIIKAHPEATNLPLLGTLYPRLSLIIEYDLGIYQALNQALVHTNTLYYVVAGSDDYFSASFFDRLAESALKNNYPRILSSIVVSNGKFISGNRCSQIWYSAMTGRYGCHSLGISIATSVHKKDLIYYDESLKIYGDQDFLYRLSRLGDSSAYTNILAGYFGVKGISSCPTLANYSEFFSLQFRHAPPFLKPLQVFLYLSRLIKLGVLNFLKY